MKRNAVLIEILLSIVCFALVMNVLVQMLSAAYSTSVRSREQSAAAITLQDALELCKSDPGLAAGKYTAYYDADFMPAEAPAEHRVETDVVAQPTEAGILYTLTAAAYAGEAEIARLTTTVYRGEVAP